MKYEDALKFVEDNQINLDKVDSNGFCYDKIIIVPTNPEQQKLFFQAYMINQDADSAIVPFMQEDVSVWAIDIKHLNEANILFYDNIAK